MENDVRMTNGEWWHLASQIVLAPANAVELSIAYIGDLDIAVNNLTAPVSDSQPSMAPAHSPGPITYCSILSYPGWKERI